MTLMQTVYTIALVLGLETVVAASYALFFSPATEVSDRTGYLAVIAISIVLLAMRFFWVPRNLNSYIVNARGARDKVYRGVTMVHFPVALLHAFIFYYVCQAFVDMTHGGFDLESEMMGDYAIRFASFYAVLLLLNAVWLRVLTSRETAGGDPGKTWAVNNVCFALLAIAALGAFEIFGFSNAALIIAVTSLFIANSAIDLWTTSKSYILYEDEPPQPVR